MKYVAVDVETANPNVSSICQIGMVLFEGGREVRAESIFVDPQTWFDPVNVAIHGINEGDVRGAETFDQIRGRLCDWTADHVVVCHAHFDRIAFHQA